MVLPFVENFAVDFPLERVNLVFQCVVTFSGRCAVWCFIIVCFLIFGTRWCPDCESILSGEVWERIPPVLHMLASCQVFSLSRSLSIWRVQLFQIGIVHVAMGWWCSCFEIYCFDSFLCYWCAACEVALAVIADSIVSSYVGWLSSGISGSMFGSAT